jgi:hypothetical protein
MKKTIRLTEADLTRIVRRVIKEQGYISDRKINRPYFIDDKSIIAPIDGYGGGIGYQTVRGTNVWLNNAGEISWPKGNVGLASNLANQLITAVSGLDATGKGAKIAKQVALEWGKLDLLTQNEFLKQWYNLTKDKSWGSPWRALNDDYEDDIAGQMIDNSIAKVKQYCKSYVDQKNKGQDSNNPVCDTFVTNDLTAPGWN